jgi:hypothetical protein
MISSQRTSFDGISVRSCVGANFYSPDALPTGPLGPRGRRTTSQASKVERLAEHRQILLMLVLAQEFRDGSERATPSTPFARAIGYLLPAPRDQALDRPDLLRVEVKARPDVGAGKSDRSFRLEMDLVEPSALAAIEGLQNGGFPLGAEGVEFFLKPPAESLRVVRCGVETEGAVAILESLKRRLLGAPDRLLDPVDS